MKAGETSQFRGDTSDKLVRVQAQILKAREIAQFRRNGSAEPVAVQVEVLKAGEVAQFRGDTSGKFVRGSGGMVPLSWLPCKSRC
jgi:hypothetical protein